MREIKFRGRHLRLPTLLGDWIYGSLYSDGADDHEPMIIAIEGEGRYYPVAPATVGQYTGLKDCKGQEIFEGDILFVKAKNRYWSKFDSKHVVTWCNDGWILNDYGTDDPGLFHILMNSDCEIIGNAYDNPELIS